MDKVIVVEGVTIKAIQAVPFEDAKQTLLDMCWEEYEEMLVKEDRDVRL